MSREPAVPPPSLDTAAVHGPHLGRTGPVSTPLLRSATFVMGTLEALSAAQAKGAAGAYYQRTGHPTIRGVEEHLAAIEGCEGALLFPSGMGAISSVFLSILKSGDHVVCVDPCYGGTQELLQFGRDRMGWDITYVDARHPERFAEAFRPHTRLFHLETPINPTLVVFDIAEAAKLGHARGATVTIDNTIASPAGQRPLEQGCDLTVYSATKSLGGHSDILAGAVMGSWKFLNPVNSVRVKFGSNADPEMAWLLERSLKTLPLRVRAANANALELATRLQKHPGVTQVFYPGLPSHPNHDVAVRQMRNGFGPLLGFEVRDGAETAVKVVEAFKLISHAVSLGGVETLASLAAHSSHKMIGVEGRKRAGIPEGLIRLSAGIESVDELWADLQQALAKVGG